MQPVFVVVGYVCGVGEVVRRGKMWHFCQHLPFFFNFGLFFPAVLHPYNKLKQCKLQFISWLLWVTPVLHRYSLQK